MYNKVQYEEKECEHCKKIFIPNRKDKKFCRAGCKIQASRKRNPNRQEKKRKRIALNRRPYIIHKKDFCDYCGFKPLHPCQLDVDHIDGDHNNNNLLNLQTLCANCHRLKTWVNKDWLK